MKRMLQYAGFLLCLAIIWLPHSTRADNVAYVVDTCTVNLRSGPTTAYRVTATLSSGAQVDVLAQRQGWSQVQYTPADGTPQQGWILTRFLADHSPWEEQAKALNASLHQKVAAMTTEKTALMQKQQQLTKQLQTTTDQLTKLQADYDSLKSGAASYLKLKNEYQSTKSSLAAAQQKVSSLTQELDRLNFTKSIQWFIAGALVLLCGWLIGLSMGRYQKKRRSTFHV